MENIRNLNLSLLSNIPLSKELQNLDNAISFIQNIVYNLNLVFEDENTILYFFNDKLYFQLIPQLTNADCWCRYNDFVETLETKYKLSNTDSRVLIKHVLEEANISSNAEIYQQSYSVTMTLDAQFKLNGKIN